MQYDDARKPLLFTTNAMLIQIRATLHFENLLSGASTLSSSLYGGLDDPIS